MKLLSHGPEPCASANSAIPAQRGYDTMFKDCCQEEFLYVVNLSVIV